MAWSIELMDSYDDGHARYSLVNGSLITTNGVRTGTNALRIFGGGFDGSATYILPSSGPTKAAAFFFTSNSGLTSVVGLLYNFNEGATTHINLFWNGDDLEVRRATTVLGTIVGVRPALNASVHINVWVNIHDTTGAVKVWINSVLELDLSGIDTRNGGAAGVIDRHIIGLKSEIVIDDLLLITADSIADAFGIDAQVVTRIVDGNGNSSQLVGSDGNSVNNFQQVDEATPSAADFNGSATPGDQDTYAFSALGVTGDVYAMTVSVHALKSGAEAISFRPLVRSLGSDEDIGAADIVLSGSMALYDTIITTDPADANPLSVAKVDAMEVGFSVRA